MVKSTCCFFSSVPSTHTGRRTSTCSSASRRFSLLSWPLSVHKCTYIITFKKSGKYGVIESNRSTSLSVMTSFLSWVSEHLSPPMIAPYCWLCEKRPGSRHWYPFCSSFRFVIRSHLANLTGLNEQRCAWIKGIYPTFQGESWDRVAGILYKWFSPHYPVLFLFALRFIFMSVFPAFVWVPGAHGAQKMLDPWGTGVRDDDCEPPCGAWELNWALWRIRLL